MEPTTATFAALTAAARSGADSLDSAADGVTAAVAALAVLEHDPAFNAGYGSVLTASESVETDGAVAMGRDQRFAAVGAAPGIRHPAALAQAVLTDRAAVLMAGDAAARFGLERGFLSEDLVTQEQLDALTGARGGSPYTGRIPIPTETIGCIVLDGAGDLFAAASTGGLRGKRSGRIGDAAIAGAGYWVDETCGVLCSGAGELAMRSLLAWRTAERAASDGAERAAEWAVRWVGERFGATIAVLVVDAAGRVGAAHHGASFPVVVRRGARTEAVPSRYVAHERS